MYLDLSVCWKYIYLPVCIWISLILYSVCAECVYTAFRQGVHGSHTLYILCVYMDPMWCVMNINAPYWLCIHGSHTQYIYCILLHPGCVYMDPIHPILNVYCIQNLVYYGSSSSYTVWLLSVYTPYSLCLHQCVSWLYLLPIYNRLLFIICSGANTLYMLSVTVDMIHRGVWDWYKHSVQYIELRLLLMWM